MPPLVLSDGEVQHLQSIAYSRSLPHPIVQRAQIVLVCGAGETNAAIAKRQTPVAKVRTSTSLQLESDVGDHGLQRLTRFPSNSSTATNHRRRLAQHHSEL